MNKKTKIILAGNDESFSKCLAALLQTTSDFEVTGLIASNRKLPEQLKQADADIILFHNESASTDEKELVDSIRSLFPSVKLIVLSDQASHALSAEPASYHLNRNCEIGILFETIRAVNSGSENSRANME
jgi:DNA-binding NarL/FixJ family response regulator